MGADRLAAALVLFGFLIALGVAAATSHRTTVDRPVDHWIVIRPI